MERLEINNLLESINTQIKHSEIIIIQSVFICSSAATAIYFIIEKILGQKTGFVTVSIYLVITFFLILRFIIRIEKLSNMYTEMSFKNSCTSEDYYRFYKLAVPEKLKKPNNKGGGFFNTIYSEKLLVVLIRIVFFFAVFFILHSLIPKLFIKYVTLISETLGPSIFAFCFDSIFFVSVFPIQTREIVIALFRLDYFLMSEFIFSLFFVTIIYIITILFIELPQYPVANKPKVLELSGKIEHSSREHSDILITSFGQIALILELPNDHIPKQIEKSLKSTGAWTGSFCGAPFHKMVWEKIPIISITGLTNAGKPCASP